MVMMLVPQLTMTIKALTMKMMIGRDEDNNPNVDSECDNEEDDDKNDIDVVQYAVTCSETTEGTQFDTLLEMVADLGRSIFKLFQVQTLIG